MNQDIEVLPRASDGLSAGPQPCHVARHLTLAMSRHGELTVFFLAAVPEEKGRQPDESPNTRVVS